MGQSQSTVVPERAPEHDSECALTLADCNSVDDVMRYHDRVQETYVHLTTQQVDIHLNGAVVLRDLVLKYCTPFIIRMVDLDPTWVVPHATQHFEAVARWKESESKHTGVKMPTQSSVHRVISVVRQKAMLRTPSVFRTRLCQSLSSWSLPPEFPPILTPLFVRYLKDFQMTLADVDAEHWDDESGAHMLMKTAPDLVCRLVSDWIHEFQHDISSRNEQCFVDHGTTVSRAVSRTWPKIKENPKDVQTLWKWLDVLLEIVRRIPGARSLDF